MVDIVFFILVRSPSTHLILNLWGSVSRYLTTVNRRGIDLTPWVADVRQRENSAL